jgi:hypothetical protein
MCFQLVLGNGWCVADGCDDDAKYSAHARIRTRCSSRRVTADPIKGIVGRDYLSQQNFSQLLVLVEHP